MSSLGLLSLSTGAHFFQLWFKLRNTNVFLVSACCQHFCTACSGATGGAQKLSGEDFEKQFYIFFFFFCLESGNIFQFVSPQGCRAERSEPTVLPPTAHPHLRSSQPCFPAVPPRPPPGHRQLLDFLSLLPCSARSWPRGQKGRMLGGEESRGTGLRWRVDR